MSNQISTHKEKEKRPRYGTKEDHVDKRKEKQIHKKDKDTKNILTSASSKIKAEQQIKQEKKSKVDNAALKMMLNLLI